MWLGTTNMTSLCFKAFIRLIIISRDAEIRRTIVCIKPAIVTHKQSKTGIACVPICVWSVRMTWHFCYDTRQREYGEKHAELGFESGW